METMMRFTAHVLAIVLLTASGHAQAGESAFRDLYTDTWVATDALGRTMPTIADVGPVKTDQPRVMSIFYITWHGDSLAGLKSPYAADVTKILAKDLAARLDAKNPLWT